MKLDVRNDKFYYQDMAFLITDRILSLFKSGVKIHYDDQYWFYDHPIDSDTEFIRWQFQVVRSNTLPTDYDIWATAGFDECAELSISISLVIPSGRWQKNICIDRSELVGTVAHEIHHIAQSTQPKCSSPIVNGELSYYLDPFEVEAFNIGFRAQSDLSGESFESICDRYLEKSGLTQDQIQEVVATWSSTSFPMIDQNFL